MSLSAATRTRIETLLANHRVVLFMCAVGAPDEARGVVRDLVSLGERSEGWMSPWLPNLADRLERRIAAFEG